MSFHDWFDLENSFDNWEGACCRSDLRARDDCLMDIQSRLSSYLRECYVSETVLHAALRRSMDEHDLDIRIEPHLPKTERIRKMAFGEALCLLFFREKDGFWAPLDKLGGGSPNPAATTSGIDILAFYFADDEDADQSDRLYIFEVKTTSDRAYVKRSIVDPKNGMSTFFNERLVHSEMIRDEINLVLKMIEKQDGQRHLIPRVLTFYLCHASGAAQAARILLSDVRVGCWTGGGRASLTPPEYQASSPSKVASCNANSSA
jgi:hypothetical protein